MTDIAFHFNVPDRLGYVCRLLRKAVTGGVKVVVTGPQDELNQLDTDLWALSTTDFVTHVGLDAPRSVLEKSSVVLADVLDGINIHSVLVNLWPLVPDGFDRYERVIEIVSQDETDRQQARRRWKYYAQTGFHLVRHDLQKVNK